MGYDLSCVGDYDEDCDRDFHLNITGMVRCVTAMEPLGMVNHDEPLGAWPDSADPAYARLVRAYVGFRGPSRGIPIRKLCSTNDGWWVWPDEIREALDAHWRAGAPLMDDWADWIAFLEHVGLEDHDGFRVD